MIKRVFAPAFAALFAALVIYGFVPPPQRTAAQFADQSTFAGTSTGSANAQAITINNIFSGTTRTGIPFRFIPGFTNTGPATINVSGLGDVAILRPSSIGLVALSGQELWEGELTSVVYNGTNYVLTSNVDMTRIGDTVQYRGGAVPRGTLIEDGSCISQTTYAALFSVIATTYGSCSAGLFALPDSRGTGFIALDGQGANGLAGRITTASCATPNAVGLCGSETKTLTLAQLPTGISSSSSGNVVTASALELENGTFNTFATLQGGTIGSVTSTSTNTSGAAHSVLNPSSFGRRAIKY